VRGGEDGQEGKWLQSPRANIGCIVCAADERDSGTLGGRRGRGALEWDPSRRHEGGPRMAAEVERQEEDMCVLVLGSAWHT